MKSINHYLQIAGEMVRQDAERERMQAAMEAMWQARWRLPEEISGLGWIHRVVSTDPHDALRVGVQVLASAAPRIKALPVGLGRLSAAGLEQVEHALAWLFHQANRRRQASVLRDIVLSALLFDEVAVQVVHLPHQIKALAAGGGSTASLQSARRYGDFANLVRNPRDVHVRYSDWLAEAVLYRQVIPAEDLVRFWGRQAEAVQSRLARAAHGTRLYATVYDYSSGKY